MQQEGADSGDNTQIIDISERAAATSAPQQTPNQTVREAPISTPDEPAEDQSKVPITLKLKDQDGGAMVFKVKMGTPLRKIMNAFAERKGVDSRILRFSYDGERVDPHHTPKMLEMQQMEEIQVFLPTHGGRV